ncbi:hypothetical protein POVWA2_018630 [Plasmodium ovale wallikeri]|uniref:Uncharacterized protein n=1 Tax=Plasmodium ovale wallikeri TaxID=864142 RepID=A0A1A8YRX0_PLAOA|nr:hypothetical protein POVWA2_018630 [Plasmodium ovale wallikeri]
MTWMGTKRLYSITLTGHIRICALQVKLKKGGKGEKRKNRAKKRAKTGRKKGEKKGKNRAKTKCQGGMHREMLAMCALFPHFAP